MFSRIICIQSRHVQLQLWRFCRFLRYKWYVQFKFYFVSDIHVGTLFWLDIYNEWLYFAAVQTEMTAEERRKKHQLELKEQLHEEAKVCKTMCLLLYFVWVFACLARLFEMWIQYPLDKLLSHGQEVTKQNALYAGKWFIQWIALSIFWTTGGVYTAPLHTCENPGNMGPWT